MGRRRFARGAVCALILVMSAGPPLGASAAGPQAAGDAGLGIRLVEAPVDRRDDPRAGVSIVDHLAPGRTITRKYELSNDTGQPLTIRTYVGSAVIRGGEFVGEDGVGNGEILQWAQVTPGSVPLQPRQKAQAQVRIAVPKDASPGERYGVIWAETPPVPGSGIAQVNRIGLRIYLSVGPGGEPASNFVIRTLTATRTPDGAPAVTAQVSNTGGRALDMRGELQLTNGPGGLSAGPFPAKLGTTLATGATEPVTVALDRALPAGPWKARLDLASGVLKRSATATITFPAAAAAASPVAAAPVPQKGAGRSDLPLIAGGILALALILGIGLASLSLLRKRARRTSAQ